MVPYVSVVASSGEGARRGEAIPAPRVVGARRASDARDSDRFRSGCGERDPRNAPCHAPHHRYDTPTHPAAAAQVERAQREREDAIVARQHRARRDAIAKSRDNASARKGVRDGKVKTMKGLHMKAARNRELEIKTAKTQMAPDEFARFEDQFAEVTETGRAESRCELN